MSNIYFLAGQANNNFEADSATVIGADTEGVLVECSLDQASALAREWGLNAPMLASDGVHYSESGDVVYIANGEQVSDIETVANALEWPGLDECGMDAEDYLHTIKRVF
jgi:hypothetical protein